MSDSNSDPKPEEKPQDSAAKTPSEGGNGDSHGQEKDSSKSAKSAAWKEAAARRMREQRNTFGTLFRGVRSDDRQVRRMSWLFILSLMGALVLLVFAGLRFFQGVQEKRKIQAERDAAKTMSEFLSRQAEERRRRVFSSNLGEFTFELSQGGQREGEESESESSKTLGVTGLAEAEIIVECDTAETCEWIDRTLPAVRHEVTLALTEVSREELIQKDGKRRLRKAIVDRLNQSLPRGRVVNAFFGRLVID